MYIRNRRFSYAILLAVMTFGALSINFFNPGMVAAQTPGPAVAEGFEFHATTPGLRYHYRRNGLKATLYKGTWIAEKVVGVKPNYVIASAEARLGKEPVVVFSLDRPEKGWPAGTYRLEVRADNRLVHTERFLIR
jgi:hypothetical protein